MDAARNKTAIIRTIFKARTRFDRLCIYKDLIATRISGVHKPNFIDIFLMIFLMKGK
tara:strand:- start:177 stop:347 length:171 start_codon:yes stop_codon:yes gene_type:complete